MILSLVSEMETECTVFCPGEAHWLGLLPVPPGLGGGMLRNPSREYGSITVSNVLPIPFTCGFMVQSRPASLFLIIG